MSATSAIPVKVGAMDREVPSVPLSLRNLPFPVTIRPARRLSDAELLAFCAENEVSRVERTAEGDLVVMTPARNRTSNREGYLFRELDLWVEREKKGIAFNANVGVVFPDGSMRMPDAAWLSTSRWDCLSEEQKDSLLPVCPEFIVELRSPSDRLSEIAGKMELWIEAGAQLGWLIDPQRQVVMVYRPGREPETLVKPEYVEGEGPVAGFRLAMERFWG